MTDAALLEGRPASQPLHLHAMRFLTIRRIGIASLTLAMVVGVMTFAPPESRLISPATAQSNACSDGFRMVDTTKAVIAADVAMVARRKALIAGGRNLGNGRKAASIVGHKAGRFTRIAEFTPTRDTGFVAIDRENEGATWAVGFQRTPDDIEPLAVRKASGGPWRMVPVPMPKRVAGTLTDVAVSSDETWTVGYLQRRAGDRSPWALRWQNGRWVADDPGLRSNEGGMLAAVSTSKQGGTWVAGTSFRGSRVRPYIARRTARGWTRADLPEVGDASLADVKVNGRSNGWAVGHNTTEAGPRPLVLRWDGKAWTMLDGPDVGEGGGILLGLTLKSGKPVVTGARWGASRDRFRPFVASFDGSTWTTSTVSSLPNHAAMLSVDGDPSTDGLAVGSGIGVQGLVARTCTASAPQASPEPGGVDPELSEATDEDPVAVDGVPDEILIEQDPDEEPEIEASALANGRIRDRAKALGLPTWSPTWSAVVDDFDGDGRDDIFLGRHGAQANLYIDDGRIFRDSGVDFGRGDRHGCASTDVDGSGLPDLYCGFGATRGNAVKANQLWLDPGGDPSLAPFAGGMPEPLGRGRYTTFIDADQDGVKDLFVGQKQGRVDGLPSSNRVYLSDGSGSFRLYGRSGIAPDIGSAGVDTADVDLDGRTDILVVYHDQLSPSGRSGVRLYRNTPSGFRDMTRQYGVRSMGDLDAELVLLDGDRKPDLVQLSDSRLRVSLQRNGSFKTTFERRIPGAVSVAAGDFDGDGDQDLYVLRQKDVAGTNDLVFLNRGKGTSFEVLAAPSRGGGQADDVVPIDHNQDGRIEFLTLNGRGIGGGPVQLMQLVAN
jgi:hypothetical protein